MADTFKASPLATAVARVIVATDSVTERIAAGTRPVLDSIAGFGLQVAYETTRLREERDKYVLGTLVIKADMLGKRTEALELWHKALRYDITWQNAIESMEQLIKAGTEELKTGTKPYHFNDFKDVPYAEDF